MDIWKKVDATGFCWVWLGYVMPNNYGQHNVGRKHVYAHRFIYELLYGPIPEGLHIDHLCRNRWCVHPEHLEAVTQAENNRRMAYRGGFAGGWQRAATHCPEGHEYTEENTRLYRGCRSCKTCARVQDRERKRLQRAA